MVMTFNPVVEKGNDLGSKVHYLVTNILLGVLKRHFLGVFVKVSISLYFGKNVLDISLYSQWLSKKICKNM